MLCSENIAVCSQIHTKHINTLCGAERGLRINRIVFKYSTRTAQFSPFR